MSKENSYVEMVSRYLGGEIPARLAAGVLRDEDSPQYRSFISRMLGLMRDAGCGAADLTQFHSFELSVVFRNALPNAWGERIPPLTFPGRHQRLDAYIADYPFSEKNGEKVFVDLGCGFPPLTVAESAENLADWRVFGVDRFFTPYVVTHADGHYACFGADGEYQYFQPVFGRSDLRKLYADPGAMRAEFIEAFAELRTRIVAEDDSRSQSVAGNGFKLTVNMLRDFERGNLSFIDGDIKDASLPPSTAVRCMNVLVYYPMEKRRRLMSRAAGSLRQGGLFLWGTNGMGGLSTRLGVARREGDFLVPTEFALSVDSILSFSAVPYFTLWEDDPEATMVAELQSVLRKDAGFWPDFSNRVCALIQEYHLAARSADGFMEIPQDPLPPGEAFIRRAEFWKQIEKEAYVVRAADSLCKAGYDAFVNRIGHLAVGPVPRPHFDRIPLDRSHSDP